MSQLLLIPTTATDTNKLGEAYEVAADLSVQYEDKTIWVPKCFQYDGASVPAPVWQLIGTPFSPRFMTAALFHDWVYHAHQIPQAGADQLFYRLLLESGVSKVRATLMREAVQGFGRWYWDNDEEDLAYLARLRTRIIDDARDPSKYGLT